MKNVSYSSTVGSLMCIMKNRYFNIYDVPLILFWSLGGMEMLIDIMWPISQSHFHISRLCSLE